MAERNALAELAERLEVEAKFAQESGRNGRPIYNASRIVSELAKVEDNMLNASCTVAMLMRCRAIAEEGANNGK